MKHIDTIFGTVGGTTLTIVSIPPQSIVTTIILATLGAVVSFMVSYVMKKLFNYFKK